MKTGEEFGSREEPAIEENAPGFFSVSIFGGAIGAICCLGVPLLVSLGSSGAVLVSLEAVASLKLYLIVGAWGIAIAAVFYVVYRRLREPEADADTGNACSQKRSSHNFDS